MKPDERELLAAKLHAIYMAEVRRQGDVVRHSDDYDSLAENVKNYDRALADYIIECIAKAEAAGFERGRDAAAAVEADAETTTHPSGTEAAGYLRGWVDGVRGMRSAIRALRAEGGG